MRIGAAGLFFGAVFGFVLGWARVTDPRAIQDMLLLEDPHLFLMMGSGVATAFVGLRVLRAVKARSLLGAEPISWSISRPRKAQVLGSVLFGAGWALALTCPAPATALLGRGSLSALLIVAGLFAGVALGAHLRARGKAGAPAPTAASVQTL